jgi:4'-phosphopantetheinyl transferase
VMQPPLELDYDQIDIWHMDLNVSAQVRAMYWDLLSLDERRRAERIVIDRPQNQFIVARGTLRLLLGRYLQQRPERIELTCDAHGKPCLTLQDAGAGLHFNLSHSHELALFALTRMGAVGIDVEQVRASVRCDDLAVRFFSAHEVKALQSLPTAERHEAFFACWTRKEAFLKAKGTGLRLPLDQFDVTVQPDAPARLLRVGWDAGEVERWQLYNVAVRAGYRAAMAVGAGAVQVRHRSASNWGQSEL